MDSLHVPRFFTVGVSPFGNPRIEAYLQLPAAYRSLSRPSSAPDAKAFTLCSCSLELPSFESIFRSTLFSRSYLNCLSFLKTWILQQKGFPSCLFASPCWFLSWQNCLQRFNVSWIFANSALAEFCYPFDWKDLISRSLKRDSSLSSLSVFSYSIFRFIRFSMSMKLFASWTPTHILSDVWLSSLSLFGSGWRKWIRTTDLTIISRVL